MESMISIEKLIGINFTIWSSKMEDILTLKNLHLLMEGKSKKPSSMTNEDWEKLDGETIASIWQYLEDNLKFHLSQEKTTESLWKKLQDLYEWDTLVTKLFLMKRLFNLKMKEGSSVDECLNELHMVFN